MEGRMKWSESANEINNEYDKWLEELQKNTLHLKQRIDFEFSSALNDVWEDCSVKNTEELKSLLNDFEEVNLDDLVDENIDDEF